MGRSLWLCSVILLFIGCGQSIKQDATATNDEYPVFSLCTSEYPSWSTFIVASKAGLIDGAAGKLGPLEKKYGIDIVLLVKDYDPCITMYANSTADASCLTNMDSLNPSLGRPGTFIMPTSTSAGGDKVIAVGITKTEQLKGMKVFGLGKSVSQYAHYRGLEKQGLNPAEYPFQNLDPAPAATAIQSGSDEIKAICVWNPYALQTLRSTPKAHCVFDSSLFPEEIIDGVLVGNDALAKPKGEDFAACICEVYYEVNKRLFSSDPKISDAAMAALGKDFSNLPVEDMRICCTDTRFYRTAEAGIELLKRPTFQKETMDTVIRICKTIGVLEAEQVDGKTTYKVPTIGFDDPGTQLNFSTKYMERVKQ